MKMGKGGIWNLNRQIQGVQYIGLSGSFHTALLIIISANIAGKSGFTRMIQNIGKRLIDHG